MYLRPLEPKLRVRTLAPDQHDHVATAHLPSRAPAAALEPVMHITEEVSAIVNKAEHWHYKSEGELNVVLSYRGDSTALRGKVLRIMKRSLGEKGHPPSPGSRPKYNADPLLVHFIDGSPSRDCGELFLREEFMEGTRTAVDPLRPQKRRDTTVIEVKSQDAYLMEDLSVLLSPSCGPSHHPPMLGVELKPKWGFLPSSPFVPESHVKRRVCRFCMQQTMKMKQGQVHHKSQYCPLDLYSTNRTRQHRALNALIEHPQNNIKIFMDGSVIYTGSLGGQSESHRLSKEELAKVLAPVLHLSGALHTVLDRFVELVSEALSRSAVLSVLQTLQATGDKWDVEGIIKLHQQLLALEHKGLDIGDHKLVLTLSADDEGKFGGPVTVGNAVRHIASFLQAATFKDCSLLLSFVQHDGPTAHDTITQHGRQYEYRVAVIDLDPKSVHNVPYYHKLDSEIVASFLLAQPDHPACHSSTPAVAHHVNGK